MSDFTYFYLQNRQSGLVLAPKTVPASPGVGLVVAQPSTDVGQLWAWDQVGRLLHVASGLVLDLAAQPPITQVTTALQLSAPVPGGRASQRWTFTDDGFLRSAVAGPDNAVLVADIFGGGTIQPGTVVNVYPMKTTDTGNQVWHAVPRRPDSEADYFYLSNPHTGLVVSPAKTPTRAAGALVMAAPATDEHQWWTWGADGSLVHVATGLVLDVTGAGTTPGTRVGLYPAYSPVRDNQSWTLTKDDNGMGGLLQSRLTGGQGAPLVLDAGDDRSPGAGVVINPASTPPSSGQRWRQPPPAREVSDQFFVFANPGSGLVLAPQSAPAPGVKIVVARQATDGSMLWMLRPDGHVVHVASGLVLDLTVQPPLTQYPVAMCLAEESAGRSGQRWTFTEDGFLRSGVAGPDNAVLVADIFGGGTIQPGTVVNAYPMKTTDTGNQVWRIFRHVTAEAALTGDAIYLNGNYQYLSVAESLTPQLTADFTFETWVRTTTGGPLFTCDGPPPDGWTPLPRLVTQGVAAWITPDGSLNFGVNGPQGPDLRPWQAWVKTAATEVLDGEWHHVAVVRHGSAGLIHLDGQRLSTSQAGNTPDMAQPFPSSQAMACGMAQQMTQNQNQRFSMPRYWLEGALDEVRLWRVARSTGEIAAGMHHAVADFDPNLLGRWSFDEGTLAPTTALDSSIYRRTATLYNAPDVIDSDVEIVPEHDYYLVTQARLMEDYRPPSVVAAQTTDPVPTGKINGYRVSIAIKNGDDASTPGYLTLWTNSGESVLAHFPDGTSSQITGDGLGVTRATDPAGALTFTIPATGLTCPVIHVRADFMQTDERIVISPDRHAHAVLATITGDELRGAGTRPPLVNVDAATANTVATGIQNLISVAQNHDVQGDRSQLHPQAAPVETRSTTPYVPRYTDVRTAPAGYDPTSNAITGHYFPLSQNVLRLTVAENTIARNWLINVNDNTCHTLSDDDAAAHRATLRINTDQSDPYANLLRHPPNVAPDGTRYATLAQLTAAAQQHAQTSARLRSTQGLRWDLPGFLSDLAGEGVALVQTLATAVKDEATEVWHEIETVVITIGQQIGTTLEQWRDWVVMTVDDAVAAIGAFFEKIGAKIEQVIEFLSDAFNWQAIIETQEVLYTAMKSFVPKAVEFTKDIADTVADGVQSLKTTLDGYITQWENQLGGPHTGGAKPAPPGYEDAKNAPPRDLQSSYLSSLFNGNFFNIPTTDLGTEVTNAAGALAQTLQTELDELGTELTGKLGQISFADVFNDPSTFFTTGLELVLQVIQALADAALDGTAALIRKLGQQAGDLLTALDSLARSPIPPIPIVTAVYEDWVMDGKTGENAQLSILGLLCLEAAVVINVAWTAATGSNKFFSDTDRDRICHQGVDSWVPAIPTGTQTTRVADGPDSATWRRMELAARVMNSVTLPLYTVLWAVAESWEVMPPLPGEPAGIPGLPRPKKAQALFPWALGAVGIIIVVSAAISTWAGVAEAEGNTTTICLLVFPFFFSSLVSVLSSVILAVDKIKPYVDALVQLTCGFVGLACGIGWVAKASQKSSSPKRQALTALDAITTFGFALAPFASYAIKLWWQDMETTFDGAPPTLTQARTAVPVIVGVTCGLASASTIAATIIEFAAPPPD
jgi:hypothetical protein